MIRTFVKLFAIIALIILLRPYFDGFLTKEQDGLVDGIAFAGMTDAVTFDDFVTDFDFGVGAFPIIRIYSEEPGIHRNDWIRSRVSISNTYSEFEIDNVSSRIRGRGNSSWVWPKKPFRIRFDTPIAMLDSGHAARDWTFIANHFDNSLMRNYAAYYFASLLDGMYVAPFARFIDVYFNGEYQGVYMVSIQHSYIVDGQVYVTYAPDPTVSEYLIELDFRARADTMFEDFIFVNMHSYEIRYPTGQDLTIEHARYVRDFLYNLEGLLLQRDEAIFDIIHLPSFVDYYIVRELFKEADAGLSSVFFQIRGQGDNRRLEMGPVWDFDRSTGNSNQTRNQMTFEYHLRSPYGIDAGIVHHWFYFLLDMPVFFDAVTKRWNEVMQDQFLQLINHMQYTAITYESSFDRNFVRWPILGERHAMQTEAIGQIDTFIGHVEYVINFLEIRSEWLYEYFNSRCCRNPWCENNMN